MSNALILPGRFLLGLYFLLPGLMKFSNPQLHLDLMALHGVPLAEPLMWIAALTNVIGGLLLIAGRYVRLTALGFVLYVILVNVLLHNFWVFEAELQNFIKNLGILAGLLVLAGATPYRGLSLKGWWRSDAALKSSSP